eukprot:s1957_g7.t1
MARWSSNKQQRNQQKEDAGTWKGGSQEDPPQETGDKKEESSEDEESGKEEEPEEDPPESSGFKSVPKAKADHRESLPRRRPADHVNKSRGADSRRAPTPDYHRSTAAPLGGVKEITGKDHALGGDIIGKNLTVQGDENNLRLRQSPRKRRTGGRRRPTVLEQSTNVTLGLSKILIGHCITGSRQTSGINPHRSDIRRNVASKGDRIYWSTCACPPFGVDAGMDLVIGTNAWEAMKLPVGAIIELCFDGSSAGLGSNTEEWCALVVLEVSGGADGAGWYFKGNVLGSEVVELGDEVSAVIAGGGWLHLCGADPCPDTAELMVHFTKCRLWAPSNFNASYVTAAGKKKLNKARKAEEEVRKTMQALEAGPAKEPRKPALRPGRGKGPPRGREEGAVDLEDGEELGKDRRDHLRGVLRRTRERILKGGGKRQRLVRFADEEESSGGAGAAGTSRAAGGMSLVAGTHLSPGHQTPFQLTDAPAGTSGTDMKSLKKRIKGMGDTASSLLVQAVQQTSRDAEKRKKRKKEKDKKDGISQLVDLLKGKQSKKKRSRRGKKSSSRTRIKKDPDDSGGSDSSHSGSYSSSEDGGKEHGDSGDDSDLSMEAPLRKRAIREPGSVMGMLVKHAQEQLDQGSLIETPSPARALTGRVRIATYFSLLIRPYYPAGSPLLRELFAMSQAIDLLRSGRLAETAGALALRFIAVHTALAEGSWATAGQLEMFPLEPIQAATTATMLEAHKHRRLVLKSQGYFQGNRAWRLRWQRPRKLCGREGQEGRRPRTRKRQREIPGKRARSSRKRRKQSLESQQGGGGPQVNMERVTDVSQEVQESSPLPGLAHAVPAPDYLGEGIMVFRRLAGFCTSLDSVGRALAWLFLNFPGFDLAGRCDSALCLTVMGKAEINYAMHRGPVPRSRPLFPLSFEGAGLMKEAAVKVSLEEFTQPHFAALRTEDVWTLVAGLGLNGVAGFGRAFSLRKPTEGQRRAADSIRGVVTRMLPAAENLERSVADAEKELATRFAALLNCHPSATAQLGLPGDQWYRPACGVIPMGWSSAVSVMEELAERLTTIGKLPAEHRVRRQAPLPSWLTQCLDQASGTGRAWYHVYLDNFCSMEKGSDASKFWQAAQLHQKLEEAWQKQGVLSSDKKRISGAKSVHELGAYPEVDFCGFS